MKTIKLSAVGFEMLSALAKNQRKTPEVFLEEIIKNLYSGKKNEGTRTISTYKKETKCD